MDQICSLTPDIDGRSVCVFVLCFAHVLINPLMDASKLHSNGPLYSNTVTGTLAIDGWAVTFGTVRSGPARLRAHPVPSSLYQM